MDRLQFLNLQFQNPPLVLLAAGWTLKATKSIASARPLPMHPALKAALLEWKSQSHYNRPEDFVFPSHIHKGRKQWVLRRCSVERSNPHSQLSESLGSGWLTFRQTVGTMLAGMGEHQLTIRDYLRHANLTVTNKYLQGSAKSKRRVQDKLMEAILPGGILGKEGCHFGPVKLLDPYGPRCFWVHRVSL
jgi:integrase